MSIFNAFYNHKKIEVETDKGIYDAKCKALVIFKVPKSKEGLLAIIKKDSNDFIYD